MEPEPPLLLDGAAICADVVGTVSASVDPAEVVTRG